ncbi:DNA polymerase epsilon subunit 3-like [Liolophura sinensis]|uniref:DNA polymerase epsilon subunit 3-like n=1 Tax=Liolophura sinensis TaxID=3198878 RepID=UPI0031598CA8
MAERPEDLNLPNTVVARIIKDAIPDGVNVSKEARLAISKAASVFVLYATSCSNNFAMKAKRKTINAQDVLAAMEDMEFDKFIEPLQQCLDGFRKEQQDKKEAVEKRKKAKEQNTAAEEKEDGIEVVEIEDSTSKEDEEEENSAVDDDDDSSVQVIEDD